MNRLQQEYGANIAFVQLNAATDGAAAFTQLALRGHPAVVIFDSAAAEIYRTFGLVEEAPIRAVLQTLANP